MNKEQIHLEENTLKFSYIGREWQVLRADMEKLWEKMVLDAPANDVLLEKNKAHEAPNKFHNKSQDTSQDKSHDKSHAAYNNSQDKDEHLPYWAELWPSSLALAKWLEINQTNIKNKYCMDLGCGLGFTALCGAYLGALVIGADYETDAITLAKENALANNFELIDFSYNHKSNNNHNIFSNNRELFNQDLFNKSLFDGQVTEKKNIRHKKNIQDKEFLFGDKNIITHEQGIDFRVMDWRFPSIFKHSLDFIWAADIVYEKAFVEPILDFLEYALKDTGKAWIAEPGRTIFEHFPAMLKDTSFKMKGVHSQETEALSANIPKANVNIWEISRL